MAQLIAPLHLAHFSLFSLVGANSTGITHTMKPINPTVGRYLTAACSQWAYSSHTHHYFVANPASRAWTRAGVEREMKELHRVRKKCFVINNVFLALVKAFYNQGVHVFHPHPCVWLLVGLSAGLHKNYWTDFPPNFSEVSAQNRPRLIKALIRNKGMDPWSSQKLSLASTRNTQLLMRSS